MRYTNRRILYFTYTVTLWQPSATASLHASAESWPRSFYDAVHRHPRVYVQQSFRVGGGDILVLLFATRGTIHTRRRKNDALGEQRQSTIGRRT